MEIQDLLRIIWRKKWLIVMITLIGGLMALYLLQDRKEAYKSEARLETGFTATEAVDLRTTDPAQELKNAEVKFSNLLELINAPISVNLLSYQLLLHDLDSTTQHFHTPQDVSVYYEENEIRKVQLMVGKKLERMVSGEEAPKSIYDLHPREEIGLVQEILKDKLENFKPLNPGEPDFELLRRFLLEYGYGFKELRDGLAVKRLPGSDYLQVEFTSDESDLSAYAANTFCREFIRYYSSLKGEYSAENVDFLKQLVDEKKVNLDTRLASLSHAESASSMPSGELGTNSRMTQLVDLETQRDQTESKISELRLTIERLKADLANQGHSSVQNNEVVQLQKSIDLLNRKYINEGARDKQLADSLAYLRGRLRKVMGELDRDTGLSETELEERLKDAQIAMQVENGRLIQTEAKIDDLNQKFTHQTYSKSRIAALSDEVEVAKTEYVEVLNKYNEAKNRQVSGNPLRQVMLATPALTSSSIKSIYLLGIAIMSCFSLAIFGVILVEVANDSIKTPSRFGRMVDMTLIGVLNRVNLRRLDIHHLFLKETRDKKANVYKASLRKLRHNVVASGAKVFLFTSLRPKVGKTSLICSLAYVLSLLKKRVLIIDTNFKSSTLTKIYGKGLHEIKVVNRKMVLTKPAFLPVAAEGVPAEEERLPMEINSLDMVNATKFEDIFFVGNNGVTSHSPAEMLNSKDFKKFVVMMADQFDYVFLEGAALNDYSDSKELLGFVQKVITVFSASDPVAPIDEESIRFLNSLGAKQGGAVLNSVNTKDMNL